MQLSYPDAIVMHSHLNSASVGMATGIMSMAIPDGIASWLGKVALGVVVALITGAIHGAAKGWTEKRMSK